MESKTKSDIAESFVTYKLIEIGLEVFLPSNAQSKTDLIVKSNSGKLTKVQIKSSDSKKNDKIRFKIAKNNIRYNNGSYRSFYNSNDVDLFLCVNLVDMEIYCMPYRNKANAFTVNTDTKTKNGQICKVNFAKDVLMKQEHFNT